MSFASNRVSIAITLSCVLALVALCAWWVFGAYGRSESANESETESLTYPPFRTAVERVVPGVVTIEVFHGPRETNDWYAHTRFGEDADSDTSDGPEPRKITGSGIVIDRHGIIVTAEHLFNDVDEATVRLADGREFPARKFASDAASDLAILRITGVDDLSEPVWADSEQLQPGDWVITIGSPFGLEGSVGAGIVSCFDREMPLADVPLIQSDAASNPGNSGGALVNQAGEIVGVCTGGTSMSGGSDGVSYAIPSNVALFVIKQLREHGKIARPLLGIELQPLTHDIAAKLNAGPAEGGVIVTDVKATLPGDRAGLQAGDIIIQIQGQPVRSRWDYTRLLSDARSGEPQSMEILRGGESLVLSVQPEFSSPNDEDVRQPEEPTRRATELGIVVTRSSDEALQGLGLERLVRGVLIEKVNPDGVGHRNHLLVGMVIRQVGERQVDSPEEFSAAIANESAATGVLLLIETSEGSQFRVIK